MILLGADNGNMNHQSEDQSMHQWKRVPTQSSLARQIILSLFIRIRCQLHDLSRGKDNINWKRELISRTLLQFKQLFKTSLQSACGSDQPSSTTPDSVHLFCMASWHLHNFNLTWSLHNLIRLGQFKCCLGMCRCSGRLNQEKNGGTNLNYRQSFTYNVSSYVSHLQHL